MSSATSSIFSNLSSRFSTLANQFLGRPTAESSTMNYLTHFTLPRDEQQDSLLFGELPGEIRDKVFSFALACYENPLKPWDKDTPYVRPGHGAVEICDTALLRTCQRVYTENWFRPWTSAVHTFYLTASERRPPDEQVTTIEKFQPFLHRLARSHGEVECSHVQVFAQMYNLESSRSLLPPILNMEHFLPRKLTVTIRHHDWWNWEFDEALHINGHWIRICRFPDSLLEVSIELETLDRKKGQVDCIAHQMIETWHLRKRNGSFMSAASNKVTVDTWRGSSIWNGERWFRDESQTVPETNEYYVKTVTWKPNKERTRRSRPANLRAPASVSTGMFPGSATRISTVVLESAGVPRGLLGEEAYRMYNAWRAARRAEEINAHRMPVDELNEGSPDTDVESSDNQDAGNDSGNEDNEDNEDDEDHEDNEDNEDDDDDDDDNDDNDFNDFNDGDQSSHMNLITIPNDDEGDEEFEPSPYQR